MFDLFRSRARSVRLLLGALMVLVALSMLTYLIPSYGGGGADDMVVAEIGENDLYLQDVHKAIQQQLRGRQLPPDMIPHMVPRVIEAMITEWALAYQAERLGFQVTDADVAATIRMLIPSLFQDGKFVGADAYAGMLAQQNTTIPEFEKDIKRQLLATRLREIVLEGSIVTSAEIEQEYRRRNEKVKIEFVKVSPEKLRSQAEVTPDEIQQYFTANAVRYQVPEKRNVAVLILDREKAAQSLQPTDADLERLYNVNKDRFRVPERVKVRHILLKTSGDAQKDAAVQAKAEELLKQLKGGANFGELAKKNSEDPGSAANGGELGEWVMRGQMVPEFEKVSFTLPVNQLSDLVKTQYGFHIVQVLAREQAHMQSFGDVKEQLATDWKNERVNDMVQQAADRAHAALQKDPTAADKVAAEFGMQVVRAERIAPGDDIPEVGGSPEFVQATAALAKGEVSQPVAVSNTKIALAVATEVFPSRASTLDEVRDQVRQALVADKADKLATARAAELFQKAASMQGDLRKAAQAMGFAVQTSEEFDRQGAVEGLGQATMLGDAFTKPAGSLFGPVAMPDARVVAKVVSRQEPDLSKLAEQRDAVREELKNRKARERNALFETGLRQQLIRDGKVKIHEDVVNRLIANYRG